MHGAASPACRKQGFSYGVRKPRGLEAGEVMHDNTPVTVRMRRQVARNRKMLWGIGYSRTLSFVEPFSWSQAWWRDINMSDGLKLYAIPNHKNGFKALITAQYAGVSIETPPYEHGVDNKKPEFYKLNPHGKVEPPPVCDPASVSGHPIHAHYRLNTVSFRFDGI